jgi:ComF family protein
MRGFTEWIGTERSGRLLGGAAARILDFLYPPLCAACRTPVGEAHSLCGACWSKMTFLDGPGCAVCGFPFEFDPGVGAICAGCQAHPPAFARALAVLRYDPASRDPILALKRADRLDLVPAFARWLERAGGPLLAESDVIVPVPLHWSRLWQRRYNQSALLGRKLAALSGVPCDTQVLKRMRATKSQGEMPSAKARRRNVRGAFRVNPSRQNAVRGRSVLLLDDVYTTGSTLEACARELQRAGAAKVLVLTVARVVRPMSTYI